MDTTSIRTSDHQNTDVFDEPRQFFRVSSQLFCMDGEWFFQTDDSDHGPFTRREAAEQALERFVEEATL